MACKELCMYQALYRKWRPMSFDDVVGQEHITDTLKNQVMLDRLSHAYLFVGTRGTGKTTCAKILSRAVNCQHPVDGNPCNICDACKGILSGNIMDVEELDAASNNGVDNVRALRDEAAFSPTAVKKRVYIIDEVHMLSTSAFNALLKIMEEPPEHLVFILATTELHKVPVTILSRCQRYSFRRISSDAVAKRLQFVSGNENISLSDDAADMLARLGEGSMRDALSLLDQCVGGGEVTAESVRQAMGLAGNSRVIELFELIASGETESAIEAFTALWLEGKEPITLLDELSVLCRDLLMCKVAPRTAAEMLVGGYDISTLKNLAKMLPEAQLLNKLKILQSTYAEMKNSQNPRVTAEMCIVFLSSPELDGDNLALQERLDRLEQIVANGVAPAVKKKAEKPVKTKPVETAAVAEPAPVVAEEPQPEPEQIPEPKPAPTADMDSGEIWKKTLKELKAVLQIGTYSILSDTACTEAIIAENTATIYIKNKFSMNMVESPQTQDTIKFVLNKVTGRAMILKLVNGNPPASAKANTSSKLDELMKFGNVKFD